MIEKIQIPFSTPKAFDLFLVCWKRLDDSGRACQRIGYELDFPRLEVFVFLKQRKRTLSLHSLHDFIGMEKHENFSYGVLFGDKDAIAQKLEKVTNGR